MEMTIKELIKQSEGLSLTVYRDTEGVPTIGYGRNLRDRGISEREAEVLLESDVEDATNIAINVVPNFFLLCRARQFALIDMAFVLGARGLRSFKKMLAAIELGDFHEAAAQAEDSKWFGQVKSRGQRDVTMLRTGIVPGEIGD